MMQRQDELPSHIFEYLKFLLGSQLSNIDISELKSAQQQVWLLENINVSNNSSNVKSSTLTIIPEEWQHALQVGNNRLIIRQWKASSTWWNLNYNNACKENDNDENNDGLIILAKSEIAGYRIARKALPKIHMPNVLYFSLEHDEKEEERFNKNPKQPWAVFSYVGEHSTIYNNGNSSNSSQGDFTFDVSWLECMVKNRFEFGFEEPHPRWGRVPENKCLDYTMSVLWNVTIPLHQYMRDYPNTVAELTKSLRSPAISCSGFTYKSMVDLYEREYENLKQIVLGGSCYYPKLFAAIQLLKKAIDKLKQQQPYLNEHLEPLVLCHMDCQPQNILFASPSVLPEGTENSRTLKEMPRISSVLDWEEAALADARFELVLLCRKVCANRKQAEIVWETYEIEHPHPNLGPLAPWLALETVHSITSLLLQSMNLLGGGRSPWESKPDLWGKIQREIRRLVLEHKWDFADTPGFR